MMPTAGIDGDNAEPAGLGWVSDYVDNQWLDEVEVYNRALTDAEIAQIFNQGKCKPADQAAKGMTWVHLISNPVAGTITLGCNNAAGVAPADKCDPYQGDTLCTQSRPILCIYGGKPTPLFTVVPPGVDS